MKLDNFLAVKPAPVNAEPPSAASQSYTAHVELKGGGYHSFTVAASSLREAYRTAQSRTAPQNFLRGVTEDAPDEPPNDLSALSRDDSAEQTPPAKQDPATVTEGDNGAESVTASERISRAGQGSAAESGPAPLDTDNSSPSVTTEIVRDVTPNGIIVEYESQPKRLYRVNGVEVPSVTTVLDVLNKGGLTVWGMRVGIQGVLSLFERGALTTGMNWVDTFEYVALNEDNMPRADVPSIEELMKEHKLTTNDVKDSAADRGTNVHDALEEWAKTGRKPIAGEFPESEMGYVQGLVEFLQDADPEPVRTEVMVGSVEHGFAGRYDLELRFNEPKKVRRTPKRAWHEIPKGTYLVDFKSSKGVYPSTHFRQLAAYEAARVECGYEPTDAQYVLNANGEGSYAFVKSTATLADFLAVLSVYNSDRQMGARKAA